MGHMYTFDTETSYRDGVAWIWSWALCDEQMRTTHGNGTNVLSWVGCLPHNSQVWVHNLPYDGEFLHWELQRAGYRLIYDIPPRERRHGVYTMLQDNNGIITMDIWTDGKRIVLHDSNRIFRRKLDKLPDLCGFSDIITKGVMDYNEVRERDHIQTESELSYQLADVRVLMLAMKWVRRFASKGNTVGAISMNEFQKSIGSPPFAPLTVEERRALKSLYSGGIVYLPTKYIGKRFSGIHGHVYDRNSMYPSESIKALPVAIKEWSGSIPYEHPGCWAVHVQAKTLRLKEKGFPLLITPFTGSAREVIPVIDKWLYMDEWESIRQDYDIKEWEMVEAISFDVSPFARDFMLHWYSVKSTDPKRKEFSKMILNNLTGKLAENPIHEQIRRQICDEEGDYLTYRYNELDKGVNPWQFMPATAKITSDSRLALRDAAMKAGIENLLYTDTDSIHTLGELPDSMIDAKRLGAWDMENNFDAALYVKPKSYWESENGVTVKCKHAGINDNATLAELSPSGEPIADTGEKISATNMQKGAYYYTNHSKRIKGGVMIAREAKRM